MHAAPQRQLGELGGQALFEPARGLAAQVQPVRRAADAHGIERRRFQQHGRGGIGDLGGQATHHACQRHRAFGVHDAKRLAGQLAVLAVQRRQPLAGPGRSDADDTAADGVPIKRVQRLARLQHHVVRHVHDRADRPHPRQLQPLAKPGRRLGHLDVAHEGRRVARAERRIVDVQVHRGPRPAVGRAGFRNRRADLGAEERGGLARNAQH